MLTTQIATESIMHRVYFVPMSKNAQGHQLITI